MTNDKGILIKNIFHMLCYAFQTLRRENYAQVQAEACWDVQDLFAAILAIGVAQQLKQGLYREYVSRHEELPVMRGKLDLPATMQLRLQRQQKLACSFDVYSDNNLHNQILKTTMWQLVRDPSVAQERKSALKKLLHYFSDIDLLPVADIPWNRLQYQRQNQNYEMLLNICYFALHDQLQTTEDGDQKMMHFLDSQMHTLYEKFILEYYRYHYRGTLQAGADLVKWDLDEEPEENSSALLPQMKTDITLRRGEKTLIIDAKYYGHTLQQNQHKKTIHSSNLYQVFAYVKNEAAHTKGEVAGMLLYAKTEEAIVPNCEYRIGGNNFQVKTLDLNQEFSGIMKQLDEIVKNYFGVQRDLLAPTAVGRTKSGPSAPASRPCVARS